MRTLFTAVLILIFPFGVTAAEFVTQESTPRGELRLLKTLFGYADIYVYITDDPDSRNSFKQGDTYIRITADDETWWVQTPEPFSEIDALEFAAGPHLLVGLRSAGAASTRVLNTRSRESHSLGQGIAEVIRDGPNQGLIRLNGQYGYDNEGRYWYSSIVDLDGRVIEFGSGGDTCLTIRHILRHGGDTTQLRQPLGSCVSVSR